MAMPVSSNLEISVKQEWRTAAVAAGWLTIPFHRDLPVVTPTLRPGEQEALARPSRRVHSSNIMQI